MLFVGSRCSSGMVSSVVKVVLSVIVVMWLLVWWVRVMVSGWFN